MSDDATSKRYPCKYCGGAHMKTFVPMKCIEADWMGRLATDILNRPFDEMMLERSVHAWEGEGGR